MKLVSVYEDEGFAASILYRLLQERERDESISHKAMPTLDQHLAFVAGAPYAHWYMAMADGYPRGAVYLTRQREIGVAILRAQRGHGYALDAVAELMRLHPGRFLANINPANAASIALFRKLGFGGPIQITLERP